MSRRVSLVIAMALAAAASAANAQHYQTDFPAEEFKARWAGVYERIGENAVAVAQGMPLTDGFQYPRQFNTFYYLSGIETPGAYIRLDGRTRTTTLYLPPRNERLERSEGKVLSAADVDLVKRLTGVDDVQPVDAMARDNWPLGVPAPPAPGSPRTGPRAPVAIYAEFAPAEGAEQSRGELVAAETARALDFWDGQTSRQKRFVELLRARVPRAEIKDLNPILDDLRAIKSPREIALVRRASQIAGLGMMESIRSTEPGVTEYQLDAASRYIYLLNDAKLEGYRSITASGTANIHNGHYYRNSSTLKDGDLVLMDYSPDYRYYVSDIGRMWPVNGKYAPWQRELLQFVLEYRNAVMTRIRPGVSTQTVLTEARQAMDPILARTKFSKPIYEQAAKRMLETSGGVFSHTVGMAVHDVGSYRAMLKPGHVFSVDPQLWVPEESLYIRYEDTVVVTDTGVLNFTDFLPSELADLEKLTLEKGVVQKVGPMPEKSMSKR